MADNRVSTSVENPGEVTILVTGAGGYIGSHACLALLEAGFNVVALDNMVNCWKDDRLPQPESLIRVQILAGRQLKFYHGDLLCKKSLETVFEEIIKEFKKIDVCMHFAALKAVGESCAKPLEYYKNNISGTINLIELLEKFGCKSLVYSSSATVYGDPSNLPISENELTGVGLTNPYGKTKYMTEEILKDLCHAIRMRKLLSDPRGLYDPEKTSTEAETIITDVMENMLNPEGQKGQNQDRENNDSLFLRAIFQWFVRNRKKLPVSEEFLRGATCTSPEGKSKFICEEILQDLATAKKDWKVISLRYFNPVGAHVSGLIGEDPNGIPNNLVPYLSQVAAGKLPKLKVFGGDYPTKDGTGVRDYIHITDLINGHIKALESILKSFSGFKAYNLGTGRGYSVLDVIKAFKEASGRDIPYEMVDRRPGDIAASYCDASLAEKELGWVAFRDINDMCTDVWRWQSRNVDGFKKETDPNCLLHSSKKLDLLLSNLTKIELQRTQRQLLTDAIDSADQRKMKEVYCKLKKLRGVLKAVETIKHRKNSCYRPVEVSRPQQSHSAKLAKEIEEWLKYVSDGKNQVKMREGLEKLKRLREVINVSASVGSGPCAPRPEPAVGLPFCGCQW